jgi:hypothetical protein
MTDLNDFVKALDKITEGVLDDFDDFDDREDDGEGEGFKGEPMYVQLGKVLDSQGNPKPVNTVTTDDGKTFKVSPQQAQMLRMLATTDKIKPMIRDKFTKDIQTSHGLADFVDIKDYHEIPALFVKRYLG